MPRPGGGRWRGGDRDHGRRRGLALLGLGADLGGFKKLFKDRTAQVERRYIDPLDELDGQVHHAEQELAGLRAAGPSSAASCGASTSTTTSATWPWRYRRARRRHREGGRRHQQLHHPGGLPGGRRWPEQMDLRRQRRPRVLHQEFLNPTYPDEHAPAAPRPRCASASAARPSSHHRRINEALAEISGVGGNLIVTLAFFRWGAVLQGHREGGSGRPVAGRRRPALPGPAGLLKTVAHSLRILHDRGIVHGDLKPSNVLIKRTELGYTTN